MNLVGLQVSAAIVVAAPAGDLPCGALADQGGQVFHLFVGVIDCAGRRQ
jgi:hypothetical protein